MIKTTEVNNFEVFEENWESFLIFLKMMTQWNVSQEMHIGLNYQSLDFLFNTYEVKNRKKVLEEIQVMEIRARSILNERKNNA